MKTYDDYDRCESGSDPLFSSEFSFALMFSRETGDTGGPCSVTVRTFEYCHISDAFSVTSTGFVLALLASSIIWPPCIESAYRRAALRISTQVPFF